MTWLSQRSSSQPASDGMVTMSGGEELRLESLVGAWRLRSAVATDANGRTWNPFGEEPEGILLYTTDRWVSATIAASGPESGRCFYAGTVQIAGDRLEHHVAVGQPPFGPGTVQVRQGRLVDDELELAAHATDPVPVTTRLRWQRPSTAESEDVSTDSPGGS
ncbi:lipocalin-like domain-containing protein [Nocardioides sp.]|nr:lipocalin-like domain-containing protein [Nocardioides sp.]